MRFTMTVEEVDGGAACRQVRAPARNAAQQLPDGAQERLWQRSQRSTSQAPLPPACLPACLQVLEGHIRVRMFGVGRIIEGIVKDSLQNVRGGVAGGVGIGRLAGPPAWPAEDVQSVAHSTPFCCVPARLLPAPPPPPSPTHSQTYKKLPEIVRRWQLFREEALRSGDGRQLLLGRPPVGCEVTWIRQEVLSILKARCGGGWRGLAPGRLAGCGCWLWGLA